MTALRRLSLFVMATVAAVVVGTVPVAPPAAAYTSTITMGISHTEIRRGEGIWLSGRLMRDHVPMGGRKVFIQKRNDSTGWRNIATVTTRADGTFTYPTVPVGTWRYRAHFPGTKSFTADSSTSVSYTFTVGKRTLEDRIAMLGSTRLGAATSGTKSHHNVSGYEVRWKSFENGTLVERKQGTNVRTFFVIGELNRVYMKRGGPPGDLGVPINDALCGLMERGCLQRFTKGALYTSPVAQQTGVAIGKGKVTGLIAVARSEVGYKAPSNNISRFNVWADSRYAWCSIFQSWVSQAGGYGTFFPGRDRFSTFHRDALARGPIGKTPRVGAIAFYDTHTYDGVTAATHAGLVTAVNGSTMTVIEGNTSPPGGGGGRGVYEKTRSVNHPLYFWYPPY